MSRIYIAGSSSEHVINTLVEVWLKVEVSDAALEGRRFLIFQEDQVCQISPREKPSAGRRKETPK